MAVRAVKDQQGRVRTGRVGAQGVGSGSSPGGGNLYTFSFLTASALPAELSLSRATVGTYFNGSGVHSDAAINAARFDHEYNGTAWIASGLRVENQSTNVAPSSNDYTAAFWFWHAVTAVAENTGPDGAVCQTLPGSNSISATGIHNNNAIGTANRCSFFARTPTSIVAGALNKTYLTVSMGPNQPPVGVTFDPATGATTQGTLATGSSVNVGNGFRRYSMVRNSGTTAGGDLLVLSYADVATPNILTSDYLFGYNF